MNNVRSEAGLARQEKLKRHDGSEDKVHECNGCENEFKASLPGLHDKPYTHLYDFAFPKRSWRTPHSRSQ